MLREQLKKAISIIENLAYLTERDMQDLSNIPKQKMFDRVDIKQKMLTDFSTLKTQIDSQILTLVNKNKNIKSLKNILSIKEKVSLDVLEDKMLSLKKINQKYNKLILGIGGFYLPLINAIIPSEMDKYNKSNKKSYLLNVVA